MAASCFQLLQAPISAAKVPQTRPKPGRNTLGRTRVRIILAGTSNMRYERKNTRTMMEYCVEVRLKSSSKPPVFALLLRGQQAFMDTSLLDSPNIGSVKKSKEVESPCTRKDTPVQLANKSFFLRRAVDPMGRTVLGRKDFSCHSGLGFVVSRAGARSGRTSIRHVLCMLTD